VHGEAIEFPRLLVISTPRCTFPNRALMRAVSTIIAAENGRPASPNPHSNIPNGARETRDPSARPAQLMTPPIPTTDLGVPNTFVHNVDGDDEV
jgi:hypothetical protein